MIVKNGFLRGVYGCWKELRKKGGKDSETHAFLDLKGVAGEPPSLNKWPKGLGGS